MDQEDQVSTLFGKIRALHCEVANEEFFTIKSLISFSYSSLWEPLITVFVIK